MKVLLLPKYSKKGPSSRYRIYQYLPHFSAHGIEYTVCPFLDDNYIDSLYSKTPYNKLSLLKNYYRRFSILLKSKKYDICFVEKEMFPFIPFLLENFIIPGKTPYLLDFDDAIFHIYDSHRMKLVRFLTKKKFENIIARAAGIITGNSYLANFANQFNPKIYEIPTSILWSKYNSAIEFKKSNPDFTIGWIGSPSSSKYLLNIKNALISVCNSRQVSLKFIGIDENIKKDFAPLPVEFISWNENNEIKDIRSFDLGIMPLDWSPFSQGKCGLKLIQYMACGLPTVSTPLPANVKIDLNKENLFANSEEEWVSTLINIIDNQDSFKQVGLNNREIIKKYYSVEKNIYKYLSAFTDLSS